MPDVRRACRGAKAQGGYRGYPPISRISITLKNLFFYISEIRKEENSMAEKSNLFHSGNGCWISINLKNFMCSFLFLADVPEWPNGTGLGPVGLVPAQVRTLPSAAFQRHSRLDFPRFFLLSRAKGEDEVKKKLVGTLPSAAFQRHSRLDFPRFQRTAEPFLDQELLCNSLVFSLSRSTKC